MTFPTFLDSLIARNMTALLGKPGVGGCYGRVTAEASGATALKKLSVYSDQGEVQVAEPPAPSAAPGARLACVLIRKCRLRIPTQVTLRQAPDAATRALYNESTFSPPSKRPGVRMLDSDAKRLMSKYAPTPHTAHARPDLSARDLPMSSCTVRAAGTARPSATAGRPATSTL